jgi:hypothetical protein
VEFDGMVLGRRMLRLGLRRTRYRELVGSSNRNSCNWASLRTPSEPPGLARRTAVTIFFQNVQLLFQNIQMDSIVGGH